MQEVLDLESVEELLDAVGRPKPKWVFKGKDLKVLLWDLPGVGRIVDMDMSWITDTGELDRGKSVFCVPEGMIDHDLAAGVVYSIDQWIREEGSENKYLSFCTNSARWCIKVGLHTTVKRVELPRL